MTKGYPFAADHRQGLRDLWIVLVEVLGEIGIFVMKRERSALFAQVQRKEVAALATLPTSERVLIVVGEVSLKEVVDVPVEVEDGALPLAMQRTPDKHGRHGAVVVGPEDKSERPEASCPAASPPPTHRRQEQPLVLRSRRRRREWRHNCRSRLPRAPTRGNDAASTLGKSYPSEPERVTRVQRFANRIGTHEKHVNQKWIRPRLEDCVVNHLESVLDTG